MKSTSQWRPSFPITKLAAVLAKAAIQLDHEVGTDPDYFAPTDDTDKRTEAAKVANHLILLSLEKVGQGAGSGLELSDAREPFFTRARKSPSEHEKKSQFDAICDYLDIDDESLVISEKDLVTGALKAARQLNGGVDYKLEDLIRDGIRRVGQELISNAVNQENRREGSKGGFTSPGSRWPQYEKAFARLKVIQGTNAWTYRKPYITLSYIAGAVDGPKSNVVQIRRWAEGVGHAIVGQPGPDEEPTAGGAIVDDKL